MVESREDSVYLAKLAEQAERYEGTLSYKPLFIFCSRLMVASLRDG
jgi:hypothetical protein